MQGQSFTLKGEYIKITLAKTKGTQIFGLMNLNNHLQSYAFEGSMNSQTVITCLDDFHTTITQPTVVVLDNAPIHHSKKFEAKLYHPGLVGSISFTRLSVLTASATAQKADTLRDTFYEVLPPLARSTAHRQL